MARALRDGAAFDTFSRRSAFDGQRDATREGAERRLEPNRVWKIIRTPRGA